MILTLTHPDYCGEGVYLQAYEELLDHLAGRSTGAWRALPSQVARLVAAAGRRTTPPCRRSAANNGSGPRRLRAPYQPGAACPFGVQSMARVLIIAYTTYVHDGRVKRHAEALAARGDTVDVITLRSGHEGFQHGVNVIGIPIQRYRGDSRAGYLGSYLRFFSRAARLSYRLGRANPYDVVITCTLPDAAVLSALPARRLGSRVVLDVHDTMPELYQDKFGGRRGAVGARLLMSMERFCAAFADRVFAVHELHRMRLEQAGIPAGKITVVMNSPQPSIFDDGQPSRGQGFGALRAGLPRNYHPAARDRDRDQGGQPAG